MNDMPLQNSIAKAIQGQHPAPGAPSLADSHLEALSPPEVVYDGTEEPAEGRRLLFEQIGRLLDVVEAEPTYRGLAIDVIHDKATNQVLCVRLVPVDVLSEGCEPARRIAA
jgi:hypothetical protein